jgi:hypothetical protein
MIGPLHRQTGKVGITTITIEVRDDRFRELEELAESLETTPEQLVQANLEIMLAKPKEDLQLALSYLLEKNEELYRQLAVQ